MRNRTKFVVALAALALGGTLLGTADAGNLVVPCPEYFSLALNSGNYLTYTGSDEDATLVIDDLSFTADMDPCQLSTRCVLFEEAFFGFPVDESDDQTSGAIGQGSFVSTGYHRLASRFVVARGKYFRATVADVDSQSVGPVFDAFSHSVYAYLAFKSRDETAYNFSYQSAGGPGPDNAASFSAATQAIAETMGVTSWATPTSESRHYQTPHIVQNGRVLFVATGYGNGTLYVKGRVILEAADVPTVSADVVVQ
jgi:hypothetical protein